MAGEGHSPHLVLANQLTISPSGGGMTDPSNTASPVRVKELCVYFKSSAYVLVSNGGACLLAIGAS